MKKVLTTVIASLIVFSTLSVFVLIIESVQSIDLPLTEWNQTYGGRYEDMAYSMIQTSDGGYAIAGHTKSFGAGNRDFWLVKTDWTGEIQWNITFGGVSDDYGRSLVETADGGYALTGYTESFGAGGYDFWLIKTDSDGNHLWNQTYGGTLKEEALSVINTTDGGYLLVGFTESFGAGGLDFWLVRTDSTGNMLWNRIYGGTNDDVARSVVQTNDEGYAILGYTYSYGAGAGDFWLIKTNSTGHEQWNQTYGGTDNDDGQSVFQTDDGGYALGGGTYSFGAGDCDFWLIKINETGYKQWDETYGGGGTENCISMVQTSDGGFASTGYTNSFGAGLQDFWLVKTDSSGNMEWNQTYGGAGKDEGRSGVQTVDGGFALTGYTNSFGAGDRDFWLVKLAPSEISATVDIDPDTLNLKSNGEWITVYVTLPEHYLVEDVDVASVELRHNDFVLATDWGEVQDGVLMVKFDRVSLRDYLGEVDVEDGDKFYDVTLAITGEVAGIPFEGHDTIIVKKK